MITVQVGLRLATGVLPLQCFTVVPDAEVALGPAVSVARKKASVPHSDPTIVCRRMMSCRTIVRWLAQSLASGRHAAPGYRANDHFLRRLPRRE